MGQPGPRPNELNWEALDITPADLATLEEPFSEQQVHKAIKEMPSDKAPGPDGFARTFFKVCWEIVKEDILLVFNSIYNLRSAHLSLMNSTNIVLIPKKDGAESVSNFRPISLIHSIAKIFSKMLAMRLRPHMHALISVNQSAFIKGRSIHDDFLFVRNMTRRYHRLRRAMLLFKLDITKAFDSFPKNKGLRLGALGLPHCLATA